MLFLVRMSLLIDPDETSSIAGGFNEWKCSFTLQLLFSLDAQTCLHNICSCLKCTVLIGSWWRQDLPSASDCMSREVMREDRRQDLRVCMCVDVVDPKARFPTKAWYKGLQFRKSRTFWIWNTLGLLKNKNIGFVLFLKATC